MKLYLDTSAILKRYLTETGSEVTDLIFNKAEAGELVITISLWNIGETLGVLDGHRRKRSLTEEQFEVVLDNFIQELVKLSRLKTLEVIPIITEIVTDAWRVLMKYHVYEADALQIATCLYNHNDALVSEDQQLIETSKKAGLHAFNVSKDAQEIYRLV